MVTAKQKAPDSYSEMAKDEHFIRFMKKHCDEIETSFWSRPKPKKGFKYRRTALDVLAEQGNLNFKFFLDNILDIWEKRSTLSSNIRAVIEWVGAEALMDTLDYYPQQDDTDNAKKTTDERSAEQ